MLLLETISLRAMKAVIVVTLVFVSIFTALQGLLRYGFGIGLQGAAEFTLLAAVWLYFFGVAYATAMDRHIAGGLIADSSKEKTWYKRTIIVRKFVSGVVCLIILYYVSQLFQLTSKANFQSASYAWPKTLWVGSIVAGFALSSAYWFLQFWALMKARKLRLKGELP